jgi:hypothetical protein
MALVDYRINVGGSANDNSGDPLRLAFQKINGAMAELYASLGNSVVPAPSVGDAGKALIVGNSGIYQLTNNAFGNANITIGVNPPPNPNTKDLWFDETGGRLYIFFDSYWVETSPPLLNYKTSVPVNASGSQGDKQGEWTADYNYYYYCTATWNGSNDPIWRRIAMEDNNNWSNA